MRWRGQRTEAMLLYSRGSTKLFAFESRRGASTFHRTAASSPPSVSDADPEVDAAADPVCLGEHLVEASETGEGVGDDRTALRIVGTQGGSRYVGNNPR
ncbi:hypothetical protein J2W42_003534 [Rhizobium tibeticum]|nr:hypothetical protein [Rhizobium tibeticum]